MGELRQTVAPTRAWACYDCGKCTATCPIARAGGHLSPRRHLLAANRGDAATISLNGTLASCLTCGQCDRRCPAGVAYCDLVLRLREREHAAAGDEVAGECPHGGALLSLMRMMGTGGTRQDRLGWLEKGLQSDPGHGEVFLFTGCAVYFDAFFPELELATLDGTRATLRLLNALGITPVVSPEERCCGHDLLWNGDRAGFERLARHNVELVAASGATTVVTPCAECARTWRLDYPAYADGSPPKVVHLAELLAERLGDLTLKGGGTQRVTFQDPCRLGRHLGVVDAPRQVLAAVPGIELVEMRHHGANATCCAGGSWTHCDSFAKRVQVGRLREARATDAELLVTSCPKCQIHLRCAMDDPALGEGIALPVSDIAQVVAAALG